MSLAEGCKQEIERRGKKADQRRDTQVEKGFLEQRKIIDPDRVANAHNGSHQRRDEHGPYDNCCRIDVQPDTRNENGENQDPWCGADEFDSTADRLINLSIVGTIIVQTEARGEALPAQPAIIFTLCRCVHDFNLTCLFGFDFKSGSSDSLPARSRNRYRFGDRSRDAQSRCGDFFAGSPCSIL